MIRMNRSPYPSREAAESAACKHVYRNFDGDTAELHAAHVKRVQRGVGGERYRPTLLAVAMCVLLTPFMVLCCAVRSLTRRRSAGTDAPSPRRAR